MRLVFVCLSDRCKALAFQVLRAVDAGGLRACRPSRTPLCRAALSAAVNPCTLRRDAVDHPLRVDVDSDSMAHPIAARKTLIFRAKRCRLQQADAAERTFRAQVGRLASVRFPSAGRANRRSVRRGRPRSAGWRLLDLGQGVAVTLGDLEKELTVRRRLVVPQRDQFTGLEHDFLELGLVFDGDRELLLAHPRQK